jgi:serine/threonine-protein kinase
MELVEGPTLADLIGRGGSSDTLPIVGRGGSLEGPPPRTPARWGGDPPARAAVIGRGGSEDPPSPRASKDAPLPIADALAIARQIAEALEAAHEQGVIHRDLKPANVKVRPDGTVKVLDFGLAKALLPAAASSSSHSMSPTITTPAMTEAGVILGTAAYMSPEQAKGRDADKRSDVWAFGCVLYEMLSGRRAFDGEDMTDVLGAVVRLEPDWAALPSSVPPLVRTMLEGCLVKDRRRRVSDISTVRFVLDRTNVAEGAAEAAHHVSAADGSPGQAAPGPAEAGHYVRKRAVLVATTILAAAGVAGAATWFVMRPAAPRIVRSTIAAEGDTLLALNGNDRDVAITPDGSRIVYRGNGKLFVRALDQLEPATLTDQGGPRGPFTSPDGQWVGFFDAAAAATLKKIAITGGPAVTVSVVDGNGPRGATWGDDGTIIFATNGTVTGLQRVSSAGGEVTVLTRPNREQGEGDHVFPESASQDASAASSFLNAISERGWFTVRHAVRRSPRR